MEKQKTIKLEYSIELKDCIKFNLFRIYSPFRLLAFIVLNAGFIFFIYSEMKSSVPDLNEIIWLCLFPFFTLILPVMIIITTKKNYRTNAFIKETQHLSIENNMFSINSSSGNVAVEWEKIYKIHETRNYFYIYISKNKAFVVAKRAFSGREDMKIFREILIVNMEKKKLKLIA